MNRKVSWVLLPFIEHAAEVATNTRTNVVQKGRKYTYGAQ